MATRTTRRLLAEASRLRKLLTRTGAYGTPRDPRRKVPAAGPPLGVAPLPDPLVAELARGVRQLERQALVAEREIRDAQSAAATTPLEIERRLVEQAMLIDRLAESVVATDLSGRIVYWSTGAEALYGHRAEEVLGKSVTLIVDSASKHEEVARIQHVVDHGVWRGRYRQLRKDGSTFMADTSITLVTDEQDRPCGFIGIDRDVEHVERIATALQQSERQFQVYFNHAPLGMAAVSSDLRIIQVNATLCRMFGYRERELLACCLTDVVRPDEPMTADELAERLLRPDLHRATWELRCRTRDDRVLWISLTAARIDGNAAAPRILIQVSDISQRHEAQQRLRSSEAFFQGTVDAISANVAILDERGTILAVNRGWRAFANRNALQSPNYGVGTNYLQACERVDDFGSDDGPLVARGIRDVIAGRSQEFLHEYPCAGEDQEFWYSVRVRRFIESDPLRVVVAHEDITARKLAEKKVRSLQADLAHVARLSTMGEMASALAHELNSPLGAIATYAEGSIGRLRSGQLHADELVQVLEQIASTALRAGTTIRRIREFVKKREFEVAPVDVNQLVREVVSLLAGEARSADIAIELVLSDRLPPAVADSIQVQQVLVNLVRNGFEAIVDSRAAVRRLQIETDFANENEVVVRVRDTGPGIQPGMEDQLFAPFWTTKAKGLGLGLSISRSIVEAQGGALSVMADKARGTTFEFTLPISTDLHRAP